MNMEPIQELASCFIPSPFIKQLPHLFSKKLGFGINFTLSAVAFSIKKFLETLSLICSCLLF